MLVIPFMELAVRDAEALGLDPDVFRAFYEEALPRVYGYLLRRCGGSVAVAEDLTQETFLASVAELKKGRRPVTPIPWIYGIARHKLLDHYRSDRGLEHPIDPATERDDLVAAPQDEDTSASTMAALAAVPAEQRAVLVLHYLDGFSMRETGSLLGKTEKAVEGLLARGRASFKKVYAEVSP